MITKSKAKLQTDNIAYDLKVMWIPSDSFTSLVLRISEKLSECSTERKCEQTFICTGLVLEIIKEAYYWFH